MTTVFIAGSMSIKDLAPEVKRRIDNIVAAGCDIVVGDADGVDAAIQRHLCTHGPYVRTTVYCSGATARNNIGAWPLRTVETKHAQRTRAFFTAKDILMAETADYGLMIWDARSTGTLSNVIELLLRRKKSVVYCNKQRIVMIVGDVPQLEALVSCMSDQARGKAEEKIRLTERLNSLRQAHLFNAAAPNSVPDRGG